MNKTDYAITFAAFNQVDYTRQCVDSMVRHGTPLDRLVVVDNASTDGTRDYLAQLPLGARIDNHDNLGCGVAWNQGALALQAEWTIVMNNDVLVSAHWIEGLIATAKRLGLRVICPAMTEGALNFDFDAFAPDAREKMGDVQRMGWCHAVCLGVHKSVWMDIGYFQPTPKLLGFEDTLFFHEMDKANIVGATTGNSWIHHFGSITQSAMKRERGLAQNQHLAPEINRRVLLGQSFVERKLARLRRKRQLEQFRATELARYGMTLWGRTSATGVDWT